MESLNDIWNKRLDKLKETPQKSWGEIKQEMIDDPVHGERYKREFEETKEAMARPIDWDADEEEDEEDED